jgi:hypothetical protein
VTPREHAIAVRATEALADGDQHLALELLEILVERPPDPPCVCALDALEDAR